MSALPESLLIPLERLMNRGIAASPAAAETAARLDQLSMVICVEPTAVQLRLSVCNGRLQLRANNADKSNVEITGTPLELMRLFFAEEHASIREGHITMTGNIEIAERFRDLFHLAGPDIEQQLARVIGVPAAFHVSNTAQSVMHWVRTMAETTADYFSDILQEDSELLPTPEEVDQFNAGVDDVSNSLARLEVRTKHLKRSLGARESRAQ